MEKVIIKINGKTAVIIEEALRVCYQKGNPYVVEISTNNIKKSVSVTKRFSKQKVHKKTVTTSNVYKKDGHLRVDAEKLALSYERHGYCSYAKAAELLGKCRRVEVEADDIVKRGRFACQNGEKIDVWMQNKGNKAVLAQHVQSEQD